MPTEEEIIAAGGKIKAAVVKFKAANPVTFGTICGFIAGCLMSWVL